MNKLKYSIIAASLLSLFFSSTSRAQDMMGSGQQDAPRFAIGVNAGLTFPFTDVKPQKTGLVVGLNGAFFATPYLHVNVDAQKGWLKGGEPVNASGVMGFENSYISGSLTVRFLPLGLLKNNNKYLLFFSGIYGGVGAGYLNNTVKCNNIKSTDYGSLGNYSGGNLMVPIEAGINLPVATMEKSRILINLNYRVNLCMSDKIDGYVPTVEANRKNDAFNTFTAGVVYNF